MPPAFYDISTPAPLLATSSPSSSAPSSSLRFPILVIVLGFIGALLVVSGIAGPCIYVFRGRLLAPEHKFDPEKGLAIDNSSYPSSSSDALNGDNPQRHEVGTSALRPLLLGRTGVTSKKGPYKPLRLPQLQLERQL
ncbi:hypothetical protein M0805_007607 [Coniferiporia weirii]|nr:hypothetical protein M0805_007607 [Coniferiporia weirii]